jgi:DNA-binding CsgD family transcriptional regulator
VAVDGSPGVTDDGFLTGPARQIYARALRAGSISAPDAAALPGVDLSAAQRELHALHRMGLLARGGRDSETYRAVDPRVALGAVASGLFDRISRITAAIPELADAYDRALVPSDGLSGTTILHGDAEIVQWYVRLQHEATSELLMFDRPPYVSAPMEALEGVVIDRGVSWRGLYTARSFEREGSWDEVQRLAERGEQSRIVPELPTKLVIADRRIALVSLTLIDGDNDALVTEAPPLVEGLRDLFERHWARGHPLARLSGLGDEQVAPARRPPTEQERAVLALMGAGLTDESIAERLGISVRSLRRRLRGVFAELGAVSRFQAGLEARRRGWL